MGAALRLYGLEGLIRREVGNQRPRGPAMRAVQQGLLAGAAPQGSARSPSLWFSVLHMLSLAPARSFFLGPVGLAGVPGEQSCRGSRCRGPIGAAEVHRFRRVFQQTHACRRTGQTFVFRACASVSLFHSKEEKKKEESLFKY